MRRPRIPSFPRPRRAAALVACLAITQAAAADVLDDIGYRALLARDNGLTVAPGSGVPVAQVEASAPSAPGTTGGPVAYAPDVAAPDFAGIDFIFRSGAPAVSGHATNVGGAFYGDATGPAPAVPSVTLFAADSFVQGLLRTGRGGRAPGGVGAMVVNNSWIAAYPSDATNLDAVRRLDHLIHRDDVLVFNAVGNAPADPFPKLLATSYNGIAVGTMTGTHGPVVFDAALGQSRIKPDLIVDVGTTSSATAYASGAGALLRGEAVARDLPAGQLAVKAILMAGADRAPDWHRGRPSGRDNVTAPLDFQQGAGRLRVDQSFDILVAGQQPADATIAPTAGWDYARTPRRGRTVTYALHVDEPLSQWAAALTWNRVIDGATPEGDYDTTQTLADLDLALYLNKRGGRRLIAYSDSPWDNVETLQLIDLARGDYQLELTTDLRSYYALAWYADPTLAPAAPPFQVAAAAATPAHATAGGLTATPVPEPTSLLWLAPLAALTRRRRAR